jgi:Lrp/AsnC family leucine-responsive transcriptional regulator
VIDEIDRKIIGSLMAEGRISFRELGERIHLSPNATAERVRGLQSSGVIRGFGAVVNRARLGYVVEAYIDVKLQPATSAQTFEAVMTKIPGIVSAAIVTGDFDFRVRVACKDQADLVRVIETLRARAGVQGTNSAVICREIDVGNASV